MSFPDTIEKIAGLLFVVALHIILLYCAWSYHFVSVPEQTVTLLVDLINPLPVEAAPLPPVKPKLSPQKVKLTKRVKPKPIELPKPPPMLLSNALAALETEPAPPVQEELVPPAVAQVPASVSQAEAEPKPAAPVQLSTLSLACPERTTPNYPAASRRMGEQGRVVLRVALDESGHVTSVKVKQSSGFQRLDQAGITAVKGWRCNAAMRDGVSVRAEALQPFDFILD